MDMTAKMRECIRIAREAGTDDDLQLNHIGDKWEVGLGNPVSCVMLGESSPIFQSGDHATPEAAVDELLEIMRRTGGIPPDDRTDEEKRRDSQTVEEWNEEQERLDNEAQARGEFVLRVRKIRASDITAGSITAPRIDALRGSGLMSSEVVTGKLEVKRDEE